MAEYILHLTGGAVPLTVNEDLRITSGVGPADIGGRLVGFVDPGNQREMLTAVKALENPESIVGWEPSIGSRAQIFGWGYFVEVVEVVGEHEEEVDDGR